MIESGQSLAVQPLIARLFAQLCDGQFHSGEALAGVLAVSRSAVWKAAKALRSLGVTVHAVRNRGYRLPDATEPLDAGRIELQLSTRVRERIQRLETAWTLTSTNTTLMERIHPPAGRSEALLAEYQTAGRGRRGRSWLAPPGGAICLSLSWTFPEVPRDLGSLGLAMGVCALRALGALGVAKVQLKWPNDLLRDQRKLGGMLIELRAESSGPACVVIGIGLNCALGPGLLSQIEKTGLPATDLASAGMSSPARNKIAAELMNALVVGLLEFERDGLRSFLDEWLAADALRGRPISVQVGEEAVRGIARGIDVEGSLLLETPQGLRRFISGDVTVRADS
jgi:BirA family biotin operon repressor/biotin-[acetyl-CoA-carboxylase] ligase